MQILKIKYVFKHGRILHDISSTTTVKAVFSLAKFRFFPFTAHSITKKAPFYHND